MSYLMKMETMNYIVMKIKMCLYPMIIVTNLFENGMPPKILEHQPSMGSASGSHSVIGEHHDHLFHNEDSCDVENEKRQPETRMRHNAKLRKLVADMGRIPVTFHKYDGRPSGNYAAMYMTELGVVVRSFAPLQVKGWKQITELQKKPMFDRLQSAFVVDFGEGPGSIKKENEQLMKECYRNNRSRMHEHYQKHCIKKPWEERLTTLPKGYCDDQSDWEFVCKMFESEEFKAKSHKNKKNRSKQKYNHRGGSKSFVQHSYECGNGPREVDRISLFKKTRYTEKNGWIEGAEPVYNEFVERQEMYRHEKEDLGSSCGDIQAMNDLEIASQACDDVLKVRSGYIRGLGKGPKPSKSNASDASSRMTNVELRQELASTREELASTIEELGTTKEELGTAKEEIHKLQVTVETNQRMMMQVFEKIAPDVLLSFMDKSRS